MNFEILIPTQEVEIAYSLIEYAEQVIDSNFILAKKVAKQLATAKYWEAYDCLYTVRKEYWRQVIMAFDNIENFRTPQPLNPSTPNT